MQTIENRQTTRAGRSKSNLRGLLVLNAVLLIVLAAVTFGAAAGAQGRGRGEYTMVAGGLPQVDGDGIYIIDVANQEMIVMTFNQQAKTLDGVTYCNLAADAARTRTGRPAK